MSINDPNFENVRFLRHPLGASNITSLSFEYYFKNIILHLLPFLIIVSINFVLTNYVINVFFPVDISVLSNLDPQTANVSSFLPV